MRDPISLSIPDRRAFPADPARFDAAVDAARRRGRRTAGRIAAVAVVAVTAMAVPGPGERAALQVTSRPEQPAATSAATRGDGPDDARQPAVAGRPGAGAAVLSTTPRRVDPPAPRPPLRRDSAPVSGDDAGPGGDLVAEYLDFSATGTASTRIVLAEDARPTGELEVETSGRYAGFYLVAESGGVAGGIFAAPRPGAARFPGRAYGAQIGRKKMTAATCSSTWCTALVFPAGAYRLYVLGEGAVRVRARLHPGEAGLAAVATQPERAWYAEQTSAVPLGSSEVRARLPIDGDSTSVGFAGGWIASEGAMKDAECRVCLTERAADCPRGKGASMGFDFTVANTQWGWAGEEIHPGALGKPRDVVARGSVGAATDARVFVWYLVLDL